MTARHIKALIPLGLFVGLALVFSLKLFQKPDPINVQLINAPFPAFSLTSLDDPQKVLDESLLKGQTTLLNVFGSWCVSCLNEHPILMKVAQDKQVSIIGINWRDQRPQAQRWLRQYGNPYDIILFDDKSELIISLGVMGAPESFIVDPSGQIRYKYVGVITPEIWDTKLWPIIKALNTRP